MQRIKQLIVIASQHMHPWGWTCFTWSSESLLHSGSRLENQALIFEALVLACLSMLPRFDQCRPIILLKTKRRQLLSTWDLSTLGVRLGVGSVLRVGVVARRCQTLCRCQTRARFGVNQGPITVRLGTPRRRHASDSISCKMQITYNNKLTNHDSHANLRATCDTRDLHCRNLSRYESMRAWT